MPLAHELDAQRPHADVELGSTWFVWGYHWRITKERTVQGVREVRMVLDKPRTSCWVPAWRVQRYGRVSGQ
jgi:hypothetical protein